MMTKFYACFVVQSDATNVARELGSIVEIDREVGSMMDHEDVAELLADNLDVNPGSLVVYHWARVH